MTKKMITIRVSVSEFNTIIGKAQASQMSVNEYSKRKMLDRSLDINKPVHRPRGRKAKPIEVTHEV